VSALAPFAALPFATPRVDPGGVPQGDPGAIRGAARRFAGGASALDAEAARIDSIAGSIRSHWLGMAEVAFALAAADTARNMRTAAGAFRDASVVLDQYASELQAAQDLARQAAARASQIQSESASLQNAYTDAQSQARAQAAAGHQVDATPLLALRGRADALQSDAAGAAAQSAAAQQQAELAAVRAAAAFEAIAMRAAALNPTTAGDLAREGGGFLYSHQKWIRAGLAVLAPGGVVAKGLASSIGHNRLLLDGRYVRVYGKRFAGDDLLSWFLRSGRVLSPGRYLAENPEVARYIDPLASGSTALRNVFDVSSPGFVREIPKGGGALAGALTFGTDAYDFSPWGAQANQGLLSTDFAATVTVDGGMLAGTTVASSAAGTLVAGAWGAEFGSVVPGLGTAVGFGVGLGIGFLMTTNTGQKIRGELIAGTKAGYDFVKDHPAVLLSTPFAPVGLGLTIYDHRGDIVSAGGTVLHGVESAPGAVVHGLDSAKDEAGKLLGKVF
jgi:uncharacterized protein YukE